MKRFNHRFEANNEITKLGRSKPSKRIITESNGWMRESISNTNDEHIKARLIDYMNERSMRDEEEELQIDCYDLSDIMRNLEYFGYRNRIEDVIRKALERRVDIYSAMYELRNEEREKEENQE